jgi:hypothetical protein
MSGADDDLCKHFLYLERFVQHARHIDFQVCLFTFTSSYSFSCSEDSAKLFMTLYTSISSFADKGLFSRFKEANNE